MTMNKYFLLLIALLITVSAYTIPTDSLFLNIPDNLLPTLTRKQRYELAEYFKAGKKDSVQNIFEKNAILLKYDTAECHIFIKTSASGSTEIKRLKIDSTVLIGIITTVNTPVKQSSLDFFTEDWKSVTYTIQTPNYKAWLDEKKLDESLVEKLWINTLLDKKYYSMWFGSSNELFVENNVLKTLTTEDLKLVKPFFVDKNIVVKL